MSTNWKIKFVDGSDTVENAVTIQEAMDSAEFKHSKKVRSASFHSSYQCVETTKMHWSDDKWGMGFGELAKS